MISGYWESINKVLGEINKQNVYLASYLIHICKGNVYVFGNGGSSSTASHFAQDMNKGHGCRFICLNDNVPSILAYGNDVGFDGVFENQLANFIKPEDIVIGISCSGNSMNIVNALTYAKHKKAITISLTGFDGGEAGAIADYNIHVPSEDMQVCEDVHMIIAHTIYKTFKREWPK